MDEKNKELEALEGALSRATAAPWTAKGGYAHRDPIPGVIEIGDDGACGDPDCCGSPSFHVEAKEEDIAAIAALRNAAPSLISEIRAARAWRKEAEALLGEARRWLPGHQNETRDKIRAFLAQWERG